MPGIKKQQEHYYFGLRVVYEIIILFYLFLWNENFNERITEDSRSEEYEYNSDKNTDDSVERTQHGSIYITAGNLDEFAGDYDDDDMEYLEQDIHQDSPSAERLDICLEFFGMSDQFYNTWRINYRKINYRRENNRDKMILMIS